MLAKCATPRRPSLLHPHRHRARHCPRASSPPLQNGGLGVDMFFALSGFLIATFWIKEVQATGRFRWGARQATNMPHVCSASSAALHPHPSRPSPLALARRVGRFLARRFLRLWPMQMLAVFYSALIAYLYDPQDGGEVRAQRAGTRLATASVVLPRAARGGAGTCKAAPSAAALAPYLPARLLPHMCVPCRTSAPA